MSLTPMMQQYTEVKEKHKDCILFYRLGDFYEMFFEDALTGARELEITLTARNCGMEEKAPMCGVPFHACEAYISKLIEKGYKVAVCEQVGDASEAKGIVRREVTRIVTPGTIVSQSMLNEKENNYLAAVYFDESSAAGFAYCDVSTGEIKATEFTGGMIYERIINETAKIRPREVLLNNTLVSVQSMITEDFIKEMKTTAETFCVIREDTEFNKSKCESVVMEQFGVKTLDGIGLSDKKFAVQALGALLSYLLETQKQSLSHITRLKVYDLNLHMTIDKATIKNLELTETLFEKKVQGSLLGVLDKTQTSMGSRKIKQWIKEPLHGLSQINERLNAVETFYNDVLLRNNMREHLKGIYDLERLSGRVACGNANGRDLIALKNSVALLPEIKAELADAPGGLLKYLYDEIDELREIYDLIEDAVQDEPPFSIKEGGLIKSGYSEELDALKDSILDGQKWIAGLETTEKERTGIKSLKVGYTKIFGYYIEVTKSYYDQVPDNYVRKQTLANCERFVTSELKEVESVVLNAETRINQMEYEIFSELKRQIQSYIPKIQKTSESIAALDVLCSFAEISAKLGYAKPEMNESDVIRIERGRHPVIEQFIKDGVFVSNDTYIDSKDSSMLLITGPNMAGKSTYMRQTALIVLMAQIGCYVPAEMAQIGVVDQIYTRIGSSDNLSQGQSTFFVEMSELAYILNTSTSKSLILLDEIGRGTSTYDGLSIAWAVVEYLCSKEHKAKTLFATHYHELTALSPYEKTFSKEHEEDILKSHQITGIKNLNVDVQDQDGNIVFLHKIVEGSASRSYGIHVAKLAGVPQQVLWAAEDKLKYLESIPKPQDDMKSTQNTVSGGQEGMQMSFFDMDHPVLTKLRQINLMNTTPLQAFEILENLKELLK